ncbi:MAG TPA: hypothetical protein VGR56_02390 [Nitrososphaerales archaeon]|nr:hypothetical protein [Nitrososphaerales archaeon]
MPTFESGSRRPSHTASDTGITDSSVPANVPQSYLQTKEFDDLRQVITIFDFSLILQTLGHYTPSVTKVNAQSLANQLGRSTYEQFGPAMLQYAIKNYEKNEVAWLWSRAKSMESATHCFEFLLSYRNSIERYINETRQRINSFERIVKLDPDSDYSKIMKSVREGGSSPTSKVKAAESAAVVAREACVLIEPYRADLGSSS